MSGPHFNQFPFFHKNFKIISEEIFRKKAKQISHKNYIKYSKKFLAKVCQKIQKQFQKMFQNKCYILRFFANFRKKYA